MRKSRFVIRISFFLCEASNKLNMINLFVCDLQDQLFWVVNNQFTWSICTLAFQVVCFI